MKGFFEDRWFSSLETSRVDDLLIIHLMMLSVAQST